MKLYLAHHLKDRYKIKEWQDEVEDRFPIKFVNPFYDIHREDIRQLDEKGVIGEENLSRTLDDCKFIVERDLEEIRKCDGVLAFVTKTIGTSMEIIMAYRIFKMPVYIISEKHSTHSWVRANSTKQFKTKEEFLDAVYRKQW